MEDMSKSNKLKDFKNGWGSTNKAVINYNKSAIDQESLVDHEGDLVGDQFSWPPRSYTCTFCNREFRSAQALGGHMNVHRREKARLRQITPFFHPQYQHKFLDLNQHPNPNPIIRTCFASNTSSFQKTFPPFTYSCCLPSSNPCHINGLYSPNNYANFNKFTSRKPDLVGDEFSHIKEIMVVKKLDTGLFAESKFDDLDLELRLGCS